MSQTPRRPPGDAGHSAEQHGGIDIDGDVNAGGDVVGRDKIEAGGDVIQIDDRDVVQVGYSAKAVQRLVIIVGALVFATAACFFSGGVVLGAAVFNALNKPINSSPEAAQSFQQKLAAVQSVSADQPFAVSFTEDELSSYVKFNACDAIGLCDGKARFLETGQVAVSGRLRSLGNLPVVVIFNLTPGADPPIQLESAAVQLLQLGGSSFGWVAVPNAFVAPFAGDVQRFLGSGYTVTEVQTSSQGAWVVTGVGQP